MEKLYYVLIDHWFNGDFHLLIVKQTDININYVLISTNNSLFPGSFLGKCSINIFLVNKHLTVILGLVQSQAYSMEGMLSSNPQQVPQILPASYLMDAKPHTKLSRMVVFF